MTLQALPRAASLSALLAPRSVAVIGASADPVFGPVERYQRGDVGRKTGRGWYDYSQPAAEAKATARAHS